MNSYTKIEKSTQGKNTFGRGFPSPKGGIKPTGESVALAHLTERFPGLPWARAGLQVVVDQVLQTENPLEW